MPIVFKKTILSIYLLISLLLLLYVIVSPNTAIIVIALFIGAALFLAFISGKLKFYHYILILVFCIILSPNIKLPGVPAIRLDDLWLMFGLVVILFTKGFKRSNFTFSFPVYAKIFLAFIAWIAVTIFFSSYKEPYFYAHSDWLEIYKNLKLLGILLIAANIKLENGMLKKIVHAALLAFFITSVFGFLQYFNAFNINSWLTVHYASTEKYGIENMSRVVGSYGNPNVFAVALLIGIAFSFSEYLHSFKVKYLLLMAVFFVAVIMTVSRTAIISGALLILIMSALSIVKTKKKVSTFLMLSFIPITILVGLQFASDKFYFRLNSLSNISTDTSYQARLINWQAIFTTRTKDNLLTGTGPVSRFRITFDNEWLMLLTLYGAIGTAIFIITFAVIYINLSKMKSNNVYYYNIALKGLLIVLAISMFTMPVFQQLQLMPIVILLIGLILNRSNLKLH